MEITRIESSADARAAAFDTLARSLDSRHPRRRVFGLLAATLATGVLGAASRSHEAAAKGKRKKKSHTKGSNNGGSGTQNTGTGNGNTPPPPPPPVLQICAAAADCGNDTNGDMCFCRDHESGKKICSKPNALPGRVFPAGTPCTTCQGTEQCFLINGGLGGIECIAPCRG